MLHFYNAPWRARIATSIFSSLALFASFVAGPVTAEAVNPSQCYDRTWSGSGSESVNANSMNRFLDCLATAQPLSLAGAQWIILLKAHWQIAEANGSTRGDYSASFANNLGNPSEKNYLHLNFRGLKASRQAVNNYVNTLEQDVFPKALRGFTDDPARNRTAVSFAATTHHYMAFADYAVGTWKRKMGREGKSNHYPGTLAVSNLFSRDWFDRATRDFPFIAEGSPEKSQHWAALRTRYEGMDYCATTLCFTRQERKVIQGLFFALANPDLVDLVHFTTHKGFGAQTGDYAFTQEALPRKYGCVGLSFTHSTTGWINYEFSGIRQPEIYRDLAAFGKWGLLGRTLYIEAFNKNDIKKTGFPGQFQGQNSVIRSISDAAVRNLRELEGFGDSGSREFADRADGENSTANRAEVRHIIDTQLSGVSKIIAEYHWDRYEFEKQYVAEKQAANSRLSTKKLWQNAVAASLKAYANHPVNTAAFFTETVITKGWTMKFWVNLLHRLNPGVVYFSFLNSLGLRPKEAYHSNWATYYDRLLFVLNNRYLPATNL